MHRRQFIASCLAVSAFGAHAETPDVLKHVPDAQKVGAGRFSHLGFDIFDATLYAPQSRYNAGAPFALKLEYLRNIKGKSITDNSVKEIQKQGVSGDKLNRWRDQMAAIFPDVSKGASITGVRDASGHALFYSGSKLLGTIKDAEFSRAFFNIWLGPKAPQTLREKLLGR
ncbi:chalcone isomerase family protein [Asticcacaulis machinosus]|uniref:Chalcone isomerase family protein n=1 Tax=Asticcacaulis machinosus TaxID=2984211 RepID=A0ABT5HMI2_9CAUL|nr:chalcone isomerase family protein [Asticcacaulis machinosus]MDC7677432.1 chalcone isomerase family protein [Asticcacaulis machinosus]